MNKNNDLLEVIIDFGELGSGVCSDLSSALVRPYRKIIKTGKPCGAITHLFAKDEIDNSYVLGSLEITSKRIIFYPGLIDRSHKWYWHKNRQLDSEIKLEGIIDHLSLDRDLKKWHATYHIDSEGEKSQKKIPTFHTINIGDLLFWFGMSIIDYSVLEPLPNKHILRFRWPSSDANRIADIIYSSKKNAVIWLIETGEKRDPQKKQFIHYDFFIGPENFKWNDEWPSFAPTSKPVLTKKCVSDTPKSIKIYEISLEGFSKRVILSAMVKEGELTAPSILTAARVSQ